jgi:hypothetical protein
VPANIPSAGVVQPDPTLEGRLSYFRPDTDFHKYTKIIIDPVQIYGGTDTSWGGTSPEDRQTIANYMGRQFTQVLDRNFPHGAPGPQTMRIRMTLVGVGENVPGAATASRLVPVGLVTNIVNSGAGNPGSFSGSVTYAIEVYDSASGQLLAAAVNKRFPDALNIVATLSTIDAAEAGIDDGATQLAKSIERLRKTQR